jgi:hypothetical protein
MAWAVKDEGNEGERFAEARWDNGFDEFPFGFFARWDGAHGELRAALLPGSLAFGWSSTWTQISTWYWC